MGTMLTVTNCSESIKALYCTYKFGGKIEIVSVSLKSGKNSILLKVILHLKEEVKHVYQMVTGLDSGTLQHLKLKCENSVKG